MSENNADGTVETPTVEQLQENLRKAEAKIVKLKQSNTTAVEVTDEPAKEEPTASMTRDDFDKRYEERKFFENNPDLAEFKESITSYTSKWLSFDDAKMIVEKKDPTYLSREKVKQSNFTSGWMPNTDKTSYTQDEISGLSQKQYNKVIELNQAGKVDII